MNKVRCKCEKCKEINYIKEDKKIEDENCWFCRSYALVADGEGGSE